MVNLKEVNLKIGGGIYHEVITIEKVALSLYIDSKSRLTSNVEA
jgi:hypothetical protein